MLILSHHPSHQALLPPAGVGWAGGEVGPCLAMELVRVPLPACKPALECANQCKCLYCFAWQPCMCWAEWEARAWCGAAAMLLWCRGAGASAAASAAPGSSSAKALVGLSMSQQRVLVQ